MKSKVGSTSGLGTVTGVGLVYETITSFYGNHYAFTYSRIKSSSIANGFLDRLKYFDDSCTLGACRDNGANAISLKFLS